MRHLDIRHLAGHGHQVVGHRAVEQPPVFVVQAFLEHRPANTLYDRPANLLKHWAVEDCGRVINPKLVDEQIRGAIVQGIGGAMFEECLYDENGRLLNGSMADYLVPMAAESGGALVLLAEEVALGGGVGLGFRDSDDELRGKFDAAIKSMKCDGTLDAMIVKEEYFGAAALTWGDAGKEGC